MKTYCDKFKGYLGDLAQRKPAPGGGSAVVLGLCLGMSLIEKALNYSITKNTNFKKQIFLLKKLRCRITPYIDIDGEIFEKFMRADGKKRLLYLEKSSEIMVMVGKCCQGVFLLAKGVESGIKKSIISDFYIGLRLTKAALYGCILNLEANSKFLGRRSIYINKFKNYLNKWQRF
jgi:formiminotetrahydrofolate cyclodeaminase